MTDSGYFVQGIMDVKVREAFHHWGSLFMLFEPYSSMNMWEICVT